MAAIIDYIILLLATAGLLFIFATIWQFTTAVKEADEADLLEDENDIINEQDEGERRPTKRLTKTERKEELKRLKQLAKEKQEVLRETNQSYDCAARHRFSNMHLHEHEGRFIVSEEHDIVDFIKSNKVVALKHLAEKYLCSIAVCLSVIRAAEKSGHLKGVLGGNNKYYYFSEERLLRVRKFIERDGMVKKDEMTKFVSSLFKGDTTHGI